MKTQVAIVGAGPAGMLLSQILRRQRISCVFIEKHSRAHVSSRIRAGVLGPTTVDVLRTTATLITGASIEKSIAPLRSFVTEPMQCGRLFLAGGFAGELQRHGLTTGVERSSDLVVPHDTAASLPEASDFDQRAQEYELEYLRSSTHAQIALAEQYAGLPLE
jgi:hypothetical protein